MHVRHDRARDVVTVDLRPGAAADALVEVYPGLHLAQDAAGHWTRLEVHQASMRMGADTLARLAASSRRSAEPPAGPRPAPAGGAVTVYSDGACLGNPGPGGWAARLKLADGRIVELGGAEAHTTNNRMELTAAIAALQRVPACAPVTVVTDSEYLRRGITEWIHGWKRHGWVTAAKAPVLNQDLWQELDRLSRPGIHWRHTRGHAGDSDNQRCDQLARAFALGQVPELAGS